MSSDRWRQIEDLCHAALAHPCRGACGRFWHKPVRAIQYCCARSSRCSRRNPAPRVHERAGSGVGGVGRTRSTRRAHSSARCSGLYRSGRCSASVGWARSTARTTRRLGAKSRSKSCRRRSRREPERRARFEREARMLATLNHPHIGAIYGVEEADGVRGLVLELVEGETLAERIARPARAGTTGARGLSSRRRSRSRGRSPTHSRLHTRRASSTVT